VKAKVAVDEAAAAEAEAEDVDAVTAAQVMQPEEDVGLTVHPQILQQGFKVQYRN
jgi:hypothetical protein